MTNIPNNFQKTNSENVCFCRKREDMKHIYECDIYNEEEAMLNYEEIYNGDMNDQIEIFRKFEENYRKREELKNIETELPCDPTGSAALL